MQKFSSQSSTQRARGWCQLAFSLVVIILVSLSLRRLDSLTFNQFVASLLPSLKQPDAPEVHTPETPVSVMPATLSAPVAVAFLQDNSGSTQKNLVKPVQKDDFKHLIEKWLLSGGMFAHGVICDESNQPLTRMTIPEPPRFDTTQLNKPTPPSPVNEELNPFHKQKATQKYNQELSTYQQNLVEDQQAIESHNQKVEKHQVTMQAEATEFIETDLSPLLNQPATCQETDIWLAVERAQIFLLESPERWHTRPQLFLVVVSDGLDTVGKPPVPLDPEIHLLLVTAGSKGVFADMEHHAFESVEAAFNHILTITAP